MPTPTTIQPDPTLRPEAMHTGGRSGSPVRDESPAGIADPSRTAAEIISPAVLVGTPATARLLAEQVGLLRSPPRIAGAILASPGSGPVGVPVLGSVEALEGARDNLGVRAVIVSLPAAMSGALAEVRREAARLGLAERIVPPLNELLATAPAVAVGSASPLLPPKIDMGALIGRRPHELDSASVSALLRGRRVLITGAGGSIGSEITRVAAAFEPECLLLMDRAENPLFEIDRQMATRFPGVRRRAYLHDVVDAEQTLRLLEQARPDVVFHAAAHKHVPLMEDHPAHAVINNLFGTKSIADAALAVGAERFVLISSDKAVNPTSVMGATKRLAELYVGRLHAAAQEGRSGDRPGPDRSGGRSHRGRAGPQTGPTCFSMVRFGNVLGSACSVLAIWSAQVAEGLPLTVTDPRMTRYFMTIPEAAGLVIQAAAIGDGDRHAPVYVLDMGAPIAILDLAQRFVRAHGFEPAVGTGGETPRGVRPVLPILYTGIRPGEKLHEELAYSAEHLGPTPYPGIRVWLGRPAAAGDTAAMIGDLSEMRPGADPAAVVAAIRRHVPEMVRPAGLEVAAAA